MFKHEKELFHPVAIEKPNPQYDLVNWVLGKIPGEQRETFNKSLETVVDAAKMIINSGIDKAMNAYSK